MSSLLKKSGFLVVTVVLMAFASSAFAEHVDWSSYIDPNPSKPIASKPVTVASDDAPVAKSSKSKKHVAKKATSKRKVKARAKKRR
jgi:hypothetical protein